MTTCLTNAQTFGSLSNGLIAHYTFSGNGNDSSSSLNSCAIVGAEFTPDRFGNTSSAIRVTAAGRWRAGGAYTSKTINISGNTSRTISYWTKFSVEGTGDGGGRGTYTQSSVSWGVDAAARLCYFGPASTGHLWFNGAGVGLDLRIPQPSVPFNEWRMVVFTFSDSPRTAVMYVNGVANTNFSPDLTSLLRLSNPTLNTTATAGSMTGGQGDYLDDVRIYNRALSANEVAQLYAYESGQETDADGDNLPIQTEITIGTDPNNPDTDNDGLKDGAEYLLADLGFDPLVPNQAIMNSIFAPSFYPSIEVFAPASTALKVSLGGITNITTNSVPTGWFYNTNTKQISGVLAGVTSFGGQLTGIKAPGLNLPVTFNFHPQSKQSIGRFLKISSKKSSSPPFSVVLPTANSGLPVLLSVKSGPATISQNNLVTITGVGTVVLAANQPGNNNFLPAPEVRTSFKVTK